MDALWNVDVDWNEDAETWDKYIDECGDDVEELEDDWDEENDLEVL
jgi:hypothetical protein